jgi:hypothetical protein
MSARLWRPPHVWPQHPTPNAHQHTHTRIHAHTHRLVYKGMSCWHGFPADPPTPTPPTPMWQPTAKTAHASTQTSQCLWQHVHAHNLEILQRARVADTICDWYAPPLSFVSHQIVIRITLDCLSVFGCQRGRGVRVV